MKKKLTPEQRENLRQEALRGNKKAERAYNALSPNQNVIIIGHEYMKICDWLKKPIPRKVRTMFDREIPELRSLNETVMELKWAEHHFYENRFLAQHERADWTGAPMEMIEFNRGFYNNLKKRGFPAYAHTIWRSPQLQQKLFNEGNSQIRSGAHQRSAATDWLHPDFHWTLPKKGWQYMGVVGHETARVLGIKIVWGGDWKSFWDPAHWELENWRDLPEVPHHTEKLTHMPSSRNMPDNRDIILKGKS